MYRANEQRLKKTYDAPCQSSSHQRKPYEQNRPRPPNRSRISKRSVPISSHAILVDQVNDYHAEKAADARDPVDEGDMNWNGSLGLVSWGVGVRGEDGGIKECPVCQCKLVSRKNQIVSEDIIHGISSTTIAGLGGDIRGLQQGRHLSFAGVCQRRY